MSSTRLRRQDVRHNERFLTADWRNLLMLNFEIDPSILEPVLPAGTELDFFDRSTFVTIVGFQWQKTRLLGIPIPFHQDFPEVNLRFYVRRRTPYGWRRGVVFIKEVVPRKAVAFVARRVYNENFVRRAMTSRVILPASETNKPGHVEYTWVNRRTMNRLRSTIHGAPALPDPGSLDEFIAEHYWGYTVERDGTTLEYRVEHPPWRIRRAENVDYLCDAAAFYGSEYAEPLAAKPASAFVADGSPVDVYRGRPLIVPPESELPAPR